MNSKCRVLLVWNRCGDYHLARRNNLASCNAFDEVYLADLAKGDELYRWDSNKEFNWHFTFSDKNVESRDILRRCKNFITVIKKHKIKFVALAGYGKLEYLLFILISKILKRKVILFAESWYGKSKLINFVKKLFISALVDGLFVSGIKAFHHFQHIIGLNHVPIVKGYSIVDNAHFKFKGEISVRSKIILCVARFSEEKNLMTLIKAFIKSKMYNEYELRLVGDGPMKDKLYTLTKVHSNINLIQWQSYEGLPALYNSAKYLVLPSKFEPWGLVVNEAMSAGLPVLISKQCGCSDDFMVEDFGLSFDAYNQEELIEQLNVMYSWPEAKYVEQSLKARKIISKYDLDHWSRQFIKIALLC